jgi:hypothetical protein
MRSHLKILVATLAAIPFAGVAQTPPATTQQPPTQTPPETMQQPPAQATTQQSEQLKPATSADVKAGASVFDQKGDTVGTVDSVDSEGVVISTGSVRAKIPLSSVGVGGKGLVIGATRAELEAAAKEQKDKPQ